MTDSISTDTKPIIAVDLDEVLGYFIESLCLFHNKHYGTNYDIETFFSYNFVDVWGGTVEESMAKMDDFFKSPEFANIQPVPHAFDVLSRLSDKFDFHIVTARQHFIEDATRTFVSTYYPNIFKSITFCNHYSTTGVKLTKLSVCQSLGAQLLIDDSYSYVRECVDNGVPCLLKGTYQWNSAYNIKKYILKKSEADIKVVDPNEYDEQLNLINFSVKNYQKDKKVIYRVQDWFAIEKYLNFIFLGITNSDDN